MCWVLYTFLRGIIALAYTFMHYSSGVSSRDMRKNTICQQFGITLITVPYWWDGTLTSLATSVGMMRPDIEMSSLYMSGPIPTEMPQKYKDKAPSTVLILLISYSAL